MTLPKADKLLLIAVPYFARSPVAPVLSSLYEPAKSTTLYLQFNSLVPPFYE